MDAAPPGAFELLAVLARHDVEFVVVGMGAAVLQGVPATTGDLDVLYRVSEDNFPKLTAALAELEAEFRADLANRRLRPDAKHVRAGGHMLLRTRFGQLDVLGSIEGTTRYEDVLGDLLELSVGELRVRVLSLRRVIESKERVRRPKDLAMLPVLRATLRELDRRG